MMRLPIGWGWNDGVMGMALSHRPSSHRPALLTSAPKARRDRECVPAARVGCVCVVGPAPASQICGCGRRESAAGGAAARRRGRLHKARGAPPPTPPTRRGLQALISSRSYRLSRAPRPSIAVLVCRALSLHRAAQRRRATTSANGKCHGGASRARRAAAVQGHRARATRVKLSTSASTVSWHKGASSGCWLPRPRGARGPVWSAVCVRTSPPCIRLHRARSHVRAG